MGIILLVAAHAGCRRIFELERCRVAVLAQQRGVFAIQYENIEVVECGWLPGIGSMTGFAGCAFSASMPVIL